MTHQRLMKILNWVQYSKYSYGLLTNDCVNNSSHRCESLKLYFLILFFFYVEASHCDSWFWKSYILWLLLALMPFFIHVLHDSSQLQWVIEISFDCIFIVVALSPENGGIDKPICLSAFIYATFSGLNWTMVCEHWSMWFVCAGVNTIIALGCGPEKRKNNASQKEKRIPSQFNGSDKVIQHQLFWS